MATFIDLGPPTIADDYELWTPTVDAEPSNLVVIRPQLHRITTGDGDRALRRMVDETTGFDPVRATWGQYHGHDLLLDLSLVGRVDSSGIGELVTSRERTVTGRSPAFMGLCCYAQIRSPTEQNPERMLADTLKITQLWTVFRMYEDLASGLRDYAAFHEEVRAASAPRSADPTHPQAPAR